MKRNHKQQTLLLRGGLSALLYAAGCAQMPSDASPQSNAQVPMEHVIVASKPGMFCGWPANNGAWTWNGGKEILVGYESGDFVEKVGHNIKGPVRQRLARSLDGGRTWQIEQPEPFVGSSGPVQPAPGGIDFQQPEFVMRLIGNGYGPGDPLGSFFVSNDKGKNWLGPYRLGKLMDAPQLQGMEFTGRTTYLTTGPRSCLFFLSARAKVNRTDRDKSFVAETTDGGKSFHFVSWIVPLDNPYRAVMPAVARLTDGTIVAALRRRSPVSETESCWVDAYGSKDNGRTWSFLSRVGDTGLFNGNPPALQAIKDGRLVCVYGDRTRRNMYARLSADSGKTWGEEIVLRGDCPPDKYDDIDFGYPRLVQNHKGQLLAIYYWSTKERKEPHIAGTFFDPRSIH